MVGFGEEANAKEWMDANKVNFPFPLLLDPEAKLYRELGLKRSIVGVWDIPLLVDLAEKALAGLKGGHFEGDDLYMLAGDYIVDSSGKLILAYSTANSHDRPNVEEILAALNKMAV